MTDELKACPFCGGEAEMFDQRRDRETPTCSGFVIDCSNTECLISPVAAGYTMTETVAAWNRRASKDYFCRDCDYVGPGLIMGTLMCPECDGTMSPSPPEGGEHG